MNFPKNLFTKIQSYLEKEKSKTKKNIKKLSADDPFADTERLNDNAALDTEAKEEEGHDRIEALGRELKNYLQRIEGAIARLRKGTYGTCASCGRVIDPKRLKAVPTAPLCLECEKKREDKK